MFKTDYKKKVIDFVKASKPRSTNHKVNSQDTFLDGVVSQVEYSFDSSVVKQWVIITKRHSNYADSESQLIQQMHTASQAYSTRFNWLNQVFNIGGIIALVLVATVVYLALQPGEGDIPEYLKTSLLTVLGFYFGGYVSQQNKNKPSTSNEG